jgi:glycosyltransferase involved in cell wall biosynthesis
MSERIPQSPPAIQSLPDHTIRPLWSVMIPTYNCSNFLVENLHSVLAQDPGAALMQIEVVDDFSTDADVERLVNEIGKGRVGFYRQPRNVGSLRNFETCLNRSNGHYIHLLHGDDQVRPGFYSEIEKLFTLFPQAGAAFTGFVYVDEQNERLYDNHTLLDKPGILQNWLLKIASSQLIQVPAMVVRRTVYEKLGGFYGVHYGEDWEMWARIAAHYPVAHSPERLALYRVHSDNITSRYFLTGQSMTDAIQVVQTIQKYLPASEQKRAKRAAEKHLAYYFARSADKIYHQYGKPYVALDQARRALGLYFGPLTFFYWLKIRVKLSIGYKMPRETAK